MTNTSQTRVAHNQGVQIAWEEYGSGDPLLLIHGLGYARWGWEPLIPLLSDRFRVITFDNRGIGESSTPPGPYTAAMMAGDSMAVLEAARAEKAHVIGTSLGGMIAQEVAIGWPQRVDKLVLMCTTPGGSSAHPMPAATTRLLIEAASWELSVALRRFTENALGEKASTELVERILRHRLTNPQDPAGWAAQAAAGTTYNGKRRAGGISAPTLLLHGTGDRVVDYRNSELLAQIIPGAELRLLADVGHLFFWEESNLVSKIILEFLS